MEEYRTPDYDPKSSALRDEVAYDTWLDRDERRRLFARRASQTQFVENRRVESDINPRYASNDPRPHPQWKPLAYDAWLDRDIQRRLAARTASDKQIAENRRVERGRVISMEYRVPDDDPKPSALRNPDAYRAWLDRNDLRVIAFEDNYNAEGGSVENRRVENRRVENRRVENRRVESDTNSAPSDHDPEPSALRNPSAFRAWLNRDIQRKTEALQRKMEAHIACYDKIFAEFRHAESGRRANARQRSPVANRFRPSQSTKISKRLQPRQANVQRSSVKSPTRKTTVKRSVPLIHNPNPHVHDNRSKDLALQQRHREVAGVEKDTYRKAGKQTDLMLPTLSDEYVLTTTEYNSAAEFQAAEPTIRSFLKKR
ncbi:hypothetical protein LTR10_001298 [Elasticomyces elasticus]|nr:hypothetical protein LTR10_001298 [Elasticomyces elasticus]KAK4965337.1 hypothetical protein LTR42_012091 [Elasticomyces elasticus]